MMATIDYKEHAQEIIRLLKTPSKIQKEGEEGEVKTIGLLNLVCKVESFGLDEHGQPKYCTCRTPEGKQPSVYVTHSFISEILDLQRKKKIGAAGAYQFISGTLEEVARLAGIDQSELFKADVQDRLALEVIMRRHDLRDYLLGDTPYGHLIWARQNAAQIWAGLPWKTNENGESISYYDGDGVNKANCTVEELDRELIAARQLIQDHFHPKQKTMTEELLNHFGFAQEMKKALTAKPYTSASNIYITNVLARIEEGTYKEGRHPFDETITPGYTPGDSGWVYDDTPPADEVKAKTPADTPYFSQMDNAGGQGWRECFSSSCAMVAAYYGKVESDDEYNEIRRGYGDSTDAQAQVKTLESLGLIAQMRFDGTAELLDKELEADRPVIVGWLHKGPVSWPTGGGHYSVVIEWNGKWIHHDPYGDADLVNGGYVAVNSPGNQSLGKAIRYSDKNWMPRWDCTSSGRGKGWWMQVMEG